MYNRRRGMEIAERARARRAKEDDALRLKDEVPALETLSLAMETLRSDGSPTEAGHTRRVVVEAAPALFIVPCGDKTCPDGSYDLTEDILRGLRANEPTFSGDSTCHGETTTGPCGRVLRWTATATYAEATAPHGAKSASAKS